MLGEKSLELIKELKRNQDGCLPRPNDILFAEIIQEIKGLYDENNIDANDALSGSDNLYPVIQIRHALIMRNVRCLIAYLYNRITRLNKMRWQFGSVLPSDLKSNLSESEIRWYANYNRNLARYMRSIGSYGGIDLTRDICPPKSLYVEVRCLQDYGEFEAHDGSVILLVRNSQHYLLRSECELLIRQGVLKHIT